MRKLILLLSAIAFAAHGQSVNNVGVMYSASPTIGNCLQATGANTAATTMQPCGGTSGTGNVNGPTSSTVNDIAAFGNGTGTAIFDTNIPYSHIGILGNNQTWTGNNTWNGGLSIFNSTASGSGAYPAAQFHAPDGSGAFGAYPNLAATNFNPMVQAGDAGIVFGTALNAGQCFDVVPWSATNSGFQLCPSNFKIVTPTLFASTSVWNPYYPHQCPGRRSDGKSLQPVRRQRHLFERQTAALHGWDKYRCSAPVLERQSLPDQQWRGGRCRLLYRSVGRAALPSRHDYRRPSRRRQLGKRRQFWLGRRGDCECSTRWRGRIGNRIVLNPVWFRCRYGRDHFLHGNSQ